MPQAVAAIYATDIISSFDIHKPEKLNNLFRIRGDQGMGYFMLLKSLGFERPVANDQYGHFEDRFVHDTFIVGANSAAGAAGATVTVTINANSFSQLGGNYYLYPRLWDLVLIQTQNGEIQAQITDVTNNNNGTGTIDLVPSQLNDAIPALVTGQELIITSNAFAEGSGQPTGALSGTDEYVNYVQIVKETLTATGTEMTNQDWFDTLTDGEGENKKIIGYYIKGQLDLDYRMALRCTNALLFQQLTTNTNTDLIDPNSVVGARPVTTEGLIPAIRRAGNVEPYTVGLFSTAKFNRIDKILDREFSGSDVTGLLGIDLSHEINDVLVDYFKDTGVDYTTKSLFGGDSGLAASVDFRSMKTSGGRVFHFQRMGQFSHPKIGGAAGYRFPQMGLFLPLNKMKDKKSGEMIPSIGSRYKKLGAYDRKMEVWDVSGAGTSRKVTPNDFANFYQRAHIGAHHIGVNRFVLLDPQ